MSVGASTFAATAGRVRRVGQGRSQRVSSFGQADEGHALFLAQVGGKHQKAKPLRGDGVFKGAGTLEVVEDFDGDTYRTVYHVKLGGVIYVLHAFQKKSKSGISTPKHDIDHIKQRLKQAKAHYHEHHTKSRNELPSSTKGSR